MLEQLQIDNLALIDHLEISFSAGMNVLSGETGAGKSILIKAVDLLLGDKAGGEMVRQGAEEGQVSALFSLPETAGGAPFRQPFGGAPDGQLLVRRTFQRGGRSRAWINGQLSSLSVLGNCTRPLVSISNQHETQALLNPARHLAFLDRFAGLEDLTDRLRKIFLELGRLLQERKRRAEQGRQREELVALWQYQADEIRQAQLTAGEEAALRQKKEVLRQAEKIWEKVQGVQEILTEADTSISNMLARAGDGLRQAAQLDPTLAPQVQELKDLGIPLQEVGLALRNYLSGLVFDSRLLEEVEDRLQLIQRLTGKYGADTAAILDYLADLERRLEERDEDSQKLKELAQAVEEKRRSCFALSEELSLRRRQTARELAGRIEGELKALGLADCRFEVGFEPQQPGPGTDPDLVYGERVLTTEGLEKIQFFMAPNPGEGLRPLSRIASGGELSRILLVLMGVLSAEGSVETVIFDEVDAGVGGGLGEKVGRKLKDLARDRQVICITHLPQIAVYADTHFQVLKTTKAQRTRTDIQRLNENDRIRELARMLSGSSSSASTIALAREFLEKARGPGSG
ncbi:MAG: DNA repair protein RecN [Deltaproteobacteria bacterium]|nr:DNA repair protein RecN [Deltaproteobacteria bacterium]